MQSEALKLAAREAALAALAQAIQSGVNAGIAEPVLPLSICQKACDSVGYTGATRGTLSGWINTARDTARKAGLIPAATPNGGNGGNAGQRQPRNVAPIITIDAPPQFTPDKNWDGETAMMKFAEWKASVAEWEANAKPRRLAAIQGAMPGVLNKCNSALVALKAIATVDTDNDTGVSDAIAALELFTATNALPIVAVPPTNNLPQATDSQDADSQATA